MNNVKILITEMLHNNNVTNYLKNNWNILYNDILENSIEIMKDKNFQKICGMAIIDLHERYIIK